MFPLGFWGGSIAIWYTSYHFQNRRVPAHLCYENHAEKKISFNGNRRPIRYESWNEAIAIRNDGNIVLVSNNVLRFGCFMPMSHGVFIKKAPSIVSPQTPCSEKNYSRDTVICKEEMSFRNHYFMCNYNTKIFAHLLIIAAVRNFSAYKLIKWNPAKIYLFKVNNIITQKRCERRSNLTIKRGERGSDLFIVNLEHISHFFLVSLLLATDR